VSKLDSLPPLRNVIQEHELIADRKLGQNFLLDLNLTDKIVNLSDIDENSNVIEIGPGPGGLTRSLLKSGANKVVAIELDHRAINALEEIQLVSDERLTILNEDALKVDYERLGLSAPRAIVSNLPYNISVPLLINWLRMIASDHGFINSMTLMFQKEVAERITARPSCKAYGRLSVISQTYCDVRILFDLPARAFTPPPKVDSSVVMFRPKRSGATGVDFEIMEKLTSLAFNQRRKMLRSSLKQYKDILEKLNINSELRAENLSVEEYIEITKALQSGL
jgi:16S rRNA (adenine1518-N6/adenine1519-N6)-dimethyltransferase